MTGMKAHTEYLTYNTAERHEMVHITPKIEEIVRRSGIVDGLCFVSPMHVTAAIYVNDHKDGLIEDISTWLENWRHDFPATNITGRARTTLTHTSKLCCSIMKRPCW